MTSTWAASLCLWSWVLPHLCLQLIYKGCFSDCKTMISQSSTSLDRRCSLLMLCPTVPHKLALKYHLTAIHHVHITPEKKLEFQETIQDMLTSWDNSSRMVWGFSRICPMHWGHTTTTVMKWQSKMDSSWREKLLSFTWLKGRGSYRQYMKGHQGITKCQYRARHCLLVRYQPRHPMHGRSMCNMSTAPSTGTMATTLANTSTWTSMTTHWCWLLIWWIWVPSDCQLLC